MAKKKKSKKNRKTFVPKRAFKEETSEPQKSEKKAQKTKKPKVELSENKKEEFKSEVKKNFYFVFVFTIILLALYFIVTKSNILDQILDYFDLAKLY